MHGNHTKGARKTVHCQACISEGIHSIPGNIRERRKWSTGVQAMPFGTRNECQKEQATTWTPYRVYHQRIHDWRCTIWDYQSKSCGAISDYVNRYSMPKLDFFLWLSSINQRVAHVFQGKTGENVVNMTLMTECGWKGRFLVVLCGPFTSEQKRITMVKTMVDPPKVIRGFEWLRLLNFKYKHKTIPHVDNIPLPYILDQER